jgi:hypothetical protein
VSHYPEPYKSNPRSRLTFLYKVHLYTLPLHKHTSSKQPLSFRFPRQNLVQSPPTPSGGYIYQNLQVWCFSFAKFLPFLRKFYLHINLYTLPLLRKISNLTLFLLSKSSRPTTVTLPTVLLSPVRWMHTRYLRSPCFLSSDWSFITFLPLVVVWIMYL